MGSNISPNPFGQGPTSTPKIGTPFTPYAAGNRTYGMGRNFPTIGTNDKTGYRERDQQAGARKSAVMRRLQNQNVGRTFQPDVLRRLG